MIAAWFLPDSGVGSWTMLQGIWRPHVWVLAGAMILTLILTPICRTIAMRYGVYDLPDERLKTHGQPIPYLGGVAIFLGWAIPVLVVAIKETAMPTGMPAATAEARPAARRPSNGSSGPRACSGFSGRLLWSCCWG
ncbi:MAG: hypothetical protein GWP05_03615 [Anaerolineaceae bacterium]|nr:hypothetical protein [Anaerolineaceae bacterium]